MGNFNLGNYGGLLSLADRNRAASGVAGTYPQNAAVQRAAQQNTLNTAGDMSGSGWAGQGGYAVAANPYAAEEYQQRSGGGGWNKANKVINGLGALKASNGSGQNAGLSKVLSLVGMFK